MPIGTTARCGHSLRRHFKMLRATTPPSGPKQYRRQSTIDILVRTGHQRIWSNSAEWKTIPFAIIQLVLKGQKLERGDRSRISGPSATRHLDLRPTGPNLNILPYNWAFRLKPLDWDRQNFSYKAHCNIHGDYQLDSIDYNPYRAYTPVASHESIRIFLALAAAWQYIVEEGDVSNAHLYDKVDCEIHME